LDSRRIPIPAFDGLRTGGPYTNPPWRGSGPIPATSDAKPVLPVDPNHSHDAVMQQLRIEGRGAGRRPTNQGFVASYFPMKKSCSGVEVGGVWQRRWRGCLPSAQ